MKFFWTLAIVDVIVAFVAVFYFSVGLDDGSIFPSDRWMWFALLGGLAALLILGFILKSKGKLVLAKTILAIPAIPAVAIAAFVLVMHFSQAKWN